MREWLRAARSEKKLTQKEIGQKCGISEAYYNAIEHGTRQKKMDVTLMMALSCALDMPLEKVAALECR